MAQSKNYGVIKDLDTLKKLIDKLGSHDGPIGYDIETGYDGPDKEKGALFPLSGAFTVGFSITDSSAWARYVPLRHDFGPNLDPDVVWPLMQPLLEQKRVVAHHAKFERKFGRVDAGVELGIHADTMLGAYVLSEHRSFGLKELVFDIFGHEMMKIQTLFEGQTAKQLKALRFNVLDVTPEVVAYACEDAAWTMALYDNYDARARSERKDMYRLEHEISELLVDMELWGTDVDWVEMSVKRSTIQSFLMKWEKQVLAELGAMAGRNLGAFKLNSTKQLGDLLYSELGLKTTVMTKGGKSEPKMSTNAIALEGLSKQYPAIKSLLQLREIQNLENRYVKWLQEKPGEVPIQGVDKRVHANYAQVVVGTGRFAANDPAIQQLPKKFGWKLSTGEEYGGNFRDFIVAAEDHYFLGYDYSQIELRVMAGLSQEPSLLKAFNDGDDVHTLTAAKMLGKSPEAIDHETERPIGKTMNFALLYGMGAQSLSERLAISKDRANELYNAYFEGFSSITTWMEKCRREGSVRGYATTHFGRKYRVWELDDANKGIRAKGERVLVNAPVQGGAADYMKIAMIRARASLREAGWWGTKVKMVANLHDALTFEVHNSLSPNEVRYVLEKAVVFPVAGFPRIVADWEVGQRWGSATSWKEGLVPEFIDGQWTLVGDSWVPDPEDDDDLETDLGTTVDEESGEVIPFPGLQATSTWVEDVVAPTTAPTETQTEGKTLIVELVDMPDQHGFSALLDLMAKNPGANTVLLKTPEGDVELDQVRTSLCPGDQARISLASGGARAYYPAEDVDSDVLLAGLAL